MKHLKSNKIESYQKINVTENKCNLFQTKERIQGWAKIGGKSPLTQASMDEEN